MIVHRSRPKNNLTEIKTLKVVWNVEYHKIFVGLCYEEMQEGNKPGTSFNNNGWNNLVAKLEKKNLENV